MTDEIRRAMDVRLAALEGSEARRARIRASIKEMEHEEETIVKRKLSVATALVMALILLGGTALAAGLGLNLFELLGKSDERLRNMADKAVLETQEPVTVEHDVIGQAEAVITNAYYDGQSLEIAYVMRNTDYAEPWTPTDEELRQMEPYDDAMWMQHLMHVAGIEPAPDGAPYGAKQYSIFASDHMTANGIEVPPQVAGGGGLEDGSSYEVIGYAVPLPEGVKDQEKLELRIPLNQNVMYFWFDGNQWYMRSEGQKDVSAMTATVYRDTSAQVQRYVGTGEVRGVPVTVTAEVSIMRGDVRVTATNAVFMTEQGSWTIDLMDEQGRYLREEGDANPADEKELHFSCYGTGTMPESLTLLLYQMDWDDPASEDAARAAGTTFMLTRE